MRSKSKFESWRKGEQFSDPNSPAVVLHILSTVRPTSHVLGLPLFSGTSFPECPPSPMLPHPMSENSCDSHSLARNTSTGTFLKTQATTWTKQLQKNENSTTYFPQLFSPKTTSDDKDQKRNKRTTDARKA